MKNNYSISTLIVMLMLMFSTNIRAGDTTTAELRKVKALIEKYDIQYPDIAFRQVIVETGWLKCEKCSLDRNNIFGFYWKKAYIEYDSWEDCVAYYKRWQDRHYKGGDYYKFLDDRGYATGPNYINKLKSLY